MPRKFTTEEKSQILTRVAEIGATAAAKEAGVHYNSILKWMKESKDTVKAGAEKIATIKTSLNWINIEKKYVIWFISRCRWIWLTEMPGS